jgi:hypothetical protein
MGLQSAPQRLRRGNPSKPPIPSSLRIAGSLGRYAGAMWRVYGGAILVIAGIAAFIEAHTHHPVAARAPLPMSPREIQQWTGQGVRDWNRDTGIWPVSYRL